MKSDQREHKRLQILHQVVEDTESFWVGGVADINKRADLGGLHTIISHFAPMEDVTQETYLKRDVLVTKTNLKLLTSILILLRPFRIVFPV